MCTRKNEPRVPCYVPRAVSGKIVRAFRLPRSEKKKKRKKKKKAHTHASHTHSNSTAATTGAGSCRNPAALRRRPAPIKAQTTTQTLGESVLPSRSSGSHQGEHAATRSRACDHVCCAAGPTARTNPSCLPSKHCTGAFGGAEGAALLLDGDEAQGDRVHPPPTPRRRRRGKSWNDGRAGTGAVSEADQGICSNRSEDSST